MANLLDIHAKKLNAHVLKFSRTVTLTEPDGTAHENLICIWNDVEHALKMDNISDNPMGAKSSVFFDTDTLTTLGIVPEKGWKLTGSPNAYDASKDYFLEIPKIDKQLPGKLFFLSEDKGTGAGWDKVD